jgi:peptide/nickel transport system ATP-binding protein
MNTPPVLTLDTLHVRFPVGADWLGRPTAVVHALNGIDLTVAKGEVLGIVGESGCGKSTLANVLTHLVAPTEGRMVWSAGTAHKLQIVFQDPQSSLDPRLPVWRLITEPVFLRQKHSTGDLRQLAGDLAEQVGLQREQLDRYPHEFSGGQRQRIAIARALSSQPDVIVLDEPTSALDISVQAQILNLLAELRNRRGLTYILISHNISVIRHLCDRIAVMYLGQIVELGVAAAVLSQPAHPYTRLLLDSVPEIGRSLDTGLAVGETELPSNRSLPQGCFFRERCPFAASGCEQRQTLLPQGWAPQWVRCHRTGELTSPFQGVTTMNPLVPLSVATHGVILDLVYASSNNIAGKPIYGRQLCLLHRDAELCLRKAVQLAAKAGCKLKIFDAFRPHEAQVALWETAVDKRYVADPQFGSNHTRGTAIDLTLVDAQGGDLDMGTDFDHMTSLSHHFSDQVSPVAQSNRTLLLNIMEQAGFQHVAHEWWHYELPSQADHPLIDSKLLGSLNPMQQQ